MSRPGRPLTKKSIQLQVINPSIVFLKYNIETPDQCGCQPAKNLDLNSISSTATSDKDGQVGGGRQELQLSACQRSRHGRRLPPCRRSQVQFHHLWIFFDFWLSYLFRDFGDSREGRGQSSVQTRHTAGGNFFVVKCCDTLRIRIYAQKVVGPRWGRVMTEVSSRVALSWSGRFHITRCGWNSCADTSSRNLLLKRTRRERYHRVVPTVPGWQRVRFYHQVRGFLRNLIGTKRQWDLTLWVDNTFQVLHSSIVWNMADHENWQWDVWW